ncbi:hypothetical protein FJU31_08080 [Stenotrophomonas cyclobalanopsidis]|uniref:HEPN AbiU2-like domain-containing protein n=1 Tax=Stenotrophomonas cyclobalanopsidis TaxID=2771362 RepID=A0ABQ6T2D9_9GAMM|nr:hypothetical protein [Stenotrophomonas cyclobalanopsidis]KAA9000295.1 hypothetical protein FJU31_08080 [Stenotrophomonas cyclobalanopsidis]
MSLPVNLLGLHAQEEQLRQIALRWIAEHADLKDHVAVTERAMDLLHYTMHHGPNTTDDERAVLQLGARVFSDMGAAWKLIASGYFQAAAMVQRDVIETVSLVEYFRLRPELVEVWRIGDERARKDTFKPWKVRKALDDAMGKGPSKRGAIYSKFSKLATHPTIEGLQLLCPNGKDATAGPYMELKQLRALLEEHAKLALQAGMIFNVILSVDTLEARVIAHSMITAMMNWMERYHGSSFTAEDRTNTNRLLET